MSRSGLPRLIRSLAAEPLAMERRTFDAFVSVLRRRGLEGMSFTGADLHAEMDVPRHRARRNGRAERNVQVIPILGAVANRSHSMGMGTREIGAMLDRAVDDSRIDAIVLDVDSPGGPVTGVPELAAKIHAVRSEKPIVAVADGLMASAGYWLGAAATEVVVTPSSRVGSIGVFTVHEDYSQWLENEGVVITEIAAGKYKTEGAPWKPLDSTADEFLRSEVAEAYQWFTADVAQFRGTSERAVRGGYGQGRVLSAKPAVAAGLADRIATLEETVVGLRAGERPGRRKASAIRARTANELEVRKRKRARMT